ncbi:MAG: hypothetical protein EA382_07020 [Spirochaetaceae bacterium]|nr:MAG: hypothetical protein EA382_07020 [Spirochaetaceae bacterium]
MPTVEGANLLHQFDFDGNLADTVASGVSLTVHPDTASHGFSSGAWWWTATDDPGGGLILETDRITDPAAYSIGLRFRFNEVGPSWVKIISFLGDEDDGGLYFYGGYLQLYPFPEDDTRLFQPGVYYDLILSRDIDGTVEVYAIDSSQTITKVYSEDDEFDDTIPVQVSNGPLRRFAFFMDDDATEVEWTSGGAVTSIRVWDGPITTIRF